MIDAQLCRDLNERRQVIAISTLSDEHVRLGSGAMAHTRGASWICKAVGVDLDGPLTGDTVNAITTWFGEREVAPVIELTSFSTEETLRLAAEAGFQLVEVENVLALVPRVVPYDAPAGITLCQLDPTDNKAVRRFAEIVSSGFVPEGEPIPEPMIESGVRSQHQATSRGVLALDESGEPVAAAGTEIIEIERGAGQAPERLLALCGTTVLPAFRRRGIQAALMK